MSSSAYISNGIGINYYTGNTQQVAYMQQVPATSSSISAGTSPAHQQQQQQQPQQCGSSTSGSSINYSTTDPGLRRRLFAGIRPLSVFGRLRQQRSSQHRSISLPESNYETLENMRGSGDSNNHNRPLHNDTSNNHVMPMQKSFHLPASTSSTTTTTTTTATTPLTSYFGDAYNSIIDPIIAMSSRWNSTAFDSHSTSMFRLCYRVLCIFFNLFPV